jgi:hypothetical protein
LGTRGWHKKRHPENSSRQKVSHKTTGLFLTPEPYRKAVPLTSTFGLKRLRNLFLSRGWGLITLVWLQPQID